MTNENNHTDDLKKLFDNSQIPELPINLENKIMAGVEIQKIRSARKSTNWFTMNLALFSLSIFILTVLALVQYFTKFNFDMLIEIKQISMLTTGIFFILWIIETADGILQSKWSNKFQPNLN